MVQRIFIENEFIHASVLPQVGGKIFDLIWKPSGKQWLWHNPRIAPRTYPIEGNFDNYWCGGWDDAFPTCDECDYGGEHFSALGELRSLEWTVDAADSRSVTLSTFGPITPVKVRKTVTVSADSPVIEMQFEVTNVGCKPVDFIWGTHPALEVSAGSKIHIPAKTGLVSVPFDSRGGTVGQRYDWPLLDTEHGTLDVSLVQSPDAALAFGHFALDLQAGWYAVDDAASSTGILFKFSKDVLPNLWMWMTYGGWRGHHTVIIEPWTSCPVKLPDAVANGTARRLLPEESFTTSVKAILYGAPARRMDAMKL